MVSLSDPWAHAHGGTLRTRAFLQGLSDLGHDVTVVHPGTSGGSPLAGVAAVGVPTSALGGRAWPGWVRRTKRALLPMPTMTGGRSAGVAAALQALSPLDALVVSVLPAAGHAGAVPEAGLLLDHSDLFSDFVQREVDLARGPARLTARLQQRHLVRLEDRLCAVARATTTAGWADAGTLHRRTGLDVGWLPTPVVGDRLPAPAARAGGRPTAGLIGHFHFGPNAAAARLLARVWAPALRDAGWHVVVAGLGSDLLDLPPYVENMGELADVSAFYAAVDVTLAPITTGGGMKVKVVESLARGRPVVGTAFAVEGFPPELRALVHVVDAARPDLAVLAGGPPPLGDVQATLAPYTQAGFTTALAGVLRRGWC